MQFITIDSIDDERVAAYTNLTEIQLRNRLEPERGLFIAESPKVIDRALAAGREPISLLVEEPWIEGMSQTFDVVDQTVGNGHPRIRGLPRTTAPAHRIPPPPRGAFGDAGAGRCRASRRHAATLAAWRSWRTSSTTPTWAH